MTGKEDGPDTSRAEELWARWLDEGGLPKEEEEELVRAAIADPRLRETILQDQRIDGALAALARTAADGPAFARQFVQRVAAERDGAAFVSSVERSVRSQVVAGARVRRRSVRLLAWLLIPAAAGAAALFFLLWRDRGRAADVQTAVLEPPRSGLPLEKRSFPFLSPPPPSAALEAPAQIAEVAGQVYRLVEAQRLSAVRGSQLPSGAGVVTVGNTSHAVVTFGEQGRLTLEGDTVLAQLAEANGAGVAARAAFLARGRLTVEAPAQSNERSLVVVTPHGEMSSRGGRFLLFVDSTSTRLDVHEGTATLARMDGGSTTVVGAAQYALIGERGDALATPVSRGGIALLVTGSLTLSQADSLTKKRLETLGFEVPTQQAGPPRAEDIRRARLVVISSTALARDMSVHFRDLVTPLIVCEPYFFDDLGMTGAVPVLDYGFGISRGAVLIKDQTHPLAAGRTGTAVLLEADRPIPRRVRRMSYGVPGPHAEVVAVSPRVPSRAMVFAYEKGVPMPGMARAPGRRVGLFLHDHTAEALSETGWAIFDAAVRWSLRD